MPLPRSVVDRTTARNWSETYRLIGLAELEGRAAWADVRAAWSEAGLAFYRPRRGQDASRRGAGRRGRRTATACKSGSTPATSTTCTAPAASATVSSFCPAAAGQRLDQAGGRSAADQPCPGTAAHPFGRDCCKARCEKRADGYILEALIPAEALTGFDPAEHPRLGFTYAVIDRELGEQTFGVGSPMPYQEDPSLWATLELQR